MLSHNDSPSNESGVMSDPKYYVPGRDIGIEHLRQGHYIGWDEKKGFTISEMDISLPDQRLKLFARGRTDWRVENIGKNVKK